MNDKDNANLTAQDKDAKSPKMPRKKKATIAGIVVAVVAGATVGMFQWHEQPSFCGAFCHYTMDAYLETFEQDAGTAGIDKYGNEVANTSALMSGVHKGEGVECLDCHVPSLGQQIEELRETVTGDYVVVARAGGDGTALHEVDTDGLMEHAGHGTDGDAFCLNESCHNLTRDELTEKTADLEFNPHRWHHEEFECSDCHKSHRASVFYCTKCHTDAQGSLPEGWIDYEQSRQILEAPAA